MIQSQNCSQHRGAGLILQPNKETRNISDHQMYLITYKDSKTKKCFNLHKPVYHNSSGFLSGIDTIWVFEEFELQLFCFFHVSIRKFYYNDNN